MWNLWLVVLAHRTCSLVLQQGLCDEELCKVALSFGSSHCWQCAGGPSEKVVPNWSDKGHTKEGGFKGT